TSEKAPSGIDRRNEESSRNVRRGKLQNQPVETVLCTPRAMAGSTLLFVLSGHEVCSSTYCEKPESDRSCQSPRRLPRVQAAGKCRARSRVAFRRDGNIGLCLRR